MAAIDLGFYVSFAGNLTFKKAEDLRDIARQLPLDRLMVETDCPYLTPVAISREAKRAGARGRDGSVPGDASWQRS